MFITPISFFFSSRDHFFFPLPCLPLFYEVTHTHSASANSAELFFKADLCFLPIPFIPMPLLFSRAYQVAPPKAIATRHVGEGGAEGDGDASRASVELKRGLPFVSQAEDVASRTCHRWSYYDAIRDETVIVELHAHYSLHVDVGSNPGTATSAENDAYNNNSGNSNAQTSASSAPPKSSEDEEGLCGYTWELTWLPSPSSSFDTSTAAGAAAAHARFAFPRSAPLSLSTLRGSGGVLFFSSRHVVISTEEAAEEQAPHISSASHSSLWLDSFIVQHEQQQQQQQQRSDETIGATALYGWRRVARSVALPCPSSAEAAHAMSLLLVCGVRLSFSAAGNCVADSETVMRVLYVAATHSEGDQQKCVFGGVADLAFASPTSSAGEEEAAVVVLRCVPRHAVSEVSPRLRLSLPVSRKQNAGVVEGGVLSELAITPHQLLWVYLADTERNDREGTCGTQLYGSLVALLPCVHDRVVASVAVSSLLPAVPCSGGFSASSPYGTLGVASNALDYFAKKQARCRQQQQQQQQGASTASSSFEVEAVLEQLLLPSTERSVYEVKIGRPTTHLQTAGTTAAAAAAATATASQVLPVHTSVLMFVFDGVVSRDVGAAAQGLSLTATSAWDEAIDTEAVVVHRVPLARTLWRGLTPVVPSSAKAARQGNNHRDRSGAIPAALSSPENSEVDSLLSWDLTDLDRWAAYLRAATTAATTTEPEAALGQEMVEADAVAEEEDDDVAVSSPLSSTTATTTATGAAAAAAAVASTRAPAASIATVTCVDATAAFSCRSSTSCATMTASTAVLRCSCLPRTSAMTHELTIWYCVDHLNRRGGGGDDAMSTGAETGARDSPSSMEVAAACLPPVCGTDTAGTDCDWESQMAEWVVSRYLLPRTTATPTRPATVNDVVGEHADGEEQAEVSAMTTTYAVVKLLWVCAVLHTYDGNATVEKGRVPAWPQVLMDVLRGTAADAAQPQARLHVYARAVQSLVSAGLASHNSAAVASRREAEMTHLHAAARVYLRLVLRTLEELDWHAGDVQGRRCGQWMARWFLGETLVITCRPSGAAVNTTRVAAMEEGRALQVLMQLGTAEAEVLAWLRRMVLLYTCRCLRRPLELTLADIVAAAAGVSSLDVVEEEQEGVGARDGWSSNDSSSNTRNEEEQEPKQEQEGPAGKKGHNRSTFLLDQQNSHVHDMAEWRESMVDALLCMVQPDVLHRALHRLAYASNSYSSPRSAAERAGRLHGLLSLADLHELVCVGWTSTQIQETAPPGVSFVFYLVDVAMRATTTTLASTAESYAALVAAALDAWEYGGEGGAAPASPSVCVPVYPLLSLCVNESTTTTSLGKTGHAAAGVAPFPFSILPPLLTVHVWYHVVDRLCRALQLLPPPPPASSGNVSTVHSSAGNDNSTTSSQPQHKQEADTWSQRYGVKKGTSEEELSAWFRRGRSDATALRGLHRGLCVLRCLVQDDPSSAEELFAAMQLVYTTSSDAQGEESGSDFKATAANLSEDVERVSWDNEYFVAWQHLLCLQPPPLSGLSAVFAYREQCRARTPRFASLMRVLHLVYASAGSGHVLRSQLWRATSGRSRRDDVHAPPLTQLECSMEAWLAAAATSTTTAGDAAQETGGEADLKPVAADGVAPWLLLVWTHVLLCDSSAVADVGIYEHVYAAFAQVKQKATTAMAAASESQSESGLVLEAASVAFRILRPCLMYACPSLLQLAVADELTAGPPENHTFSEPHRSREGSVRETGGVARQCFLQFNEPLVWQNAAMATLDNDALQQHEWEQLCAGEVYERARRQLGRLVGLYEASTALSPSKNNNSNNDSGLRNNGDVRFRVLAMLLSLQPAVVDVAQRQQRLLRAFADAAQKQPQQKLPQQEVTDFMPSAKRVVEDEPTSTRSEPSNEGADSDAEAAMELTHFYLSPTAAYVMAASSTHIFADSPHDEVSRRTSPSAQRQRQRGQEQQRSPRELGWFVIVCEVLRRELRAYVVAELILARCIARAEDKEGKKDVAAAGMPAPPQQWRLVASERELKAFINALADAVEPLTQALVAGLRCPLYHSVLLLLVFDILHELFFPTLLSRAADEVETSRGDVAVDGTVPSSFTLAIRAATPLLQLLTKWIRQVVAPLHRKLSVTDQKTVALIVTDNFSREYFAETQARPHPAREKEAAPATYAETELHRTWQQWRRQGGATAAVFRVQADAETEAAVLACVEMCVSENQRTSLHVLSPSTAPAAVAAASRATDSAHGSNNDDSATVSLSWIEAGSALRSSLFHTISAKVAPRSGGGGLPTPKPGPVVTEDAEEPRPLLRRVSHTQVSEEAVQLLCKEEFFLRRQLALQLLNAQQQDFFASPAFQHALIDLYLALRAEKRRKELTAFALDQHDLIFAFVSREQQLLHGACRRELRQVWIDFGERQRLALRRLLQEERDGRMGVQALAYAERSFLRDAEKAEAKAWILQEEGRRGLELLEQDARDALSMAAARAQLELAKRAVEAEEAASWKAAEEEKEEWVQMGKGSGSHGDGGRLRKGTEEKEEGDAGAQRAALAGDAASSHKVTGAASPTTAAPSSSSSQFAPTRPSIALPVAPKPSREDESFLQTKLAHVVAQAAAEVGTNGLLGTLARWQTALRETVAPAPPPHQNAERQKTAEESTSATSAHATRVAPAKTDDKREAEEEEEDWGWGSESSNEEASSAKPAKVSSIVPLTSRRTLPLHAAAASALHTGTRSENGNINKIHNSGGAAAAAAAQPAARKPVRAKKGFGATLLVEPITSTANTTATAASVFGGGAAAAADAQPATLPSCASHAEQPASRLHTTADTFAGAGEATTSRPGCPEDATPNPARSILSAVEAAATETISKGRRTAPLPSPAAPERKAVEGREEQEVEEVDKTPLRKSKEFAQQQQTMKDGAAPAHVDGWSDDGKSYPHGSHSACLTSVEARPLPVAPVVTGCPPGERNNQLDDKMVFQAAEAEAKSSAAKKVTSETEHKSGTQNAEDDDDWNWNWSEGEEEGDNDDADDQDNKKVDGCRSQTQRQLPFFSLAAPFVAAAAQAKTTDLEEPSQHVRMDAPVGQALPPNAGENKKANDNDDDDGWSWSEEEEEENAKSTAAFPNSADKPAEMTSEDQKAVAASRAVTAAPSGAGVPTRPPSATGPVAPLTTTTKLVPLGWSNSDNDDGSSFGSDIVPQPPKPLFLPFRPTATDAPKSTDLHLQQLYLAELELREQMLSIL